MCITNIVAAVVAPRQVRRVTFADAGGFLSVDREAIGVRFDITFEHAVGGVVLEHVDHVVEIDEGIVDGNDVDVISGDRSSADESGKNL